MSDETSKKDAELKPETQRQAAIADAHTRLQKEGRDLYAPLPSST